MLANPIEMINQGFVKNLKDHAKQVQPNAIDWTVDKICRFTNNTIPFVISESEKQMRSMQELEVGADGYWHLAPNSAYDISSDMFVTIPATHAALLLPRSTFVRNGCWLASGIFDSGYEGSVAGVLHTGDAPVLVAPGTRIAQIMFIESNSAKMYDGGYNHKEGTHWAEANK